MSKIGRIILIVLLFGLLAAVRYFQGDLFYDPLILFFKTSQAANPLPDLVVPKYYLHLALRYFLNTAISLSLLWVLFKKQGIVKVSAVIYVVFFVLLMCLMVLSIQTSEIGGYQFLFYIRRFLIQPVLLLLLIPAFYFIKK